MRDFRSGLISAAANFRPATPEITMAVNSNEPCPSTKPQKVSINSKWVKCPAAAPINKPLKIRKNKVPTPNNIPPAKLRKPMPVLFFI